MIFHKCAREGCNHWMGPDIRYPMPPHYRGVDLLEEGWLPEGDGWVCPECSGNQVEVPLRQMSLFGEQREERTA